MAGTITRAGVYSLAVAVVDPVSAALSPISPRVSPSSITVGYRTPPPSPLPAPTPAAPPFPRSHANVHAPSLSVEKKCSVEAFWKFSHASTSRAIDGRVNMKDPPFICTESCIETQALPVGTGFTETYQQSFNAPRRVPSVRTSPALQVVPGELSPKHTAVQGVPATITAGLPATFTIWPTDQNANRGAPGASLSTCQSLRTESGYLPKSSTSMRKLSSVVAWVFTAPAAVRCLPVVVARPQISLTGWM